MVLYELDLALKDLVVRAGRGARLRIPRDPSEVAIKYHCTSACFRYSVFDSVFHLVRTSLSVLLQVRDYLAAGGRHIDVGLAGPGAVLAGVGAALRQGTASVRSEVTEDRASGVLSGLGCFRDFQGVFQVV